MFRIKLAGDEATKIEKLHALRPRCLQPLGHPDLTVWRGIRTPDLFLGDYGFNDVNFYGICFLREPQDFRIEVPCALDWI